MVVHTPSKLEVLRQTAAQRRTSGASDNPDVPPSVLAANTATAPPAVRTEDLLGGEIVDTEHDFDAWDGGHPPGSRIQVDVHESEMESSNVTTRRGPGPVRFNDLTDASGEAAASTQRSGVTPDTDKISVVSDVTPPPPASAMPSSGDHPQINPFTPEWFAQLVEAAASAAASAAVSAHA